MTHPIDRPQRERRTWLLGGAILLAVMLLQLAVNLNLTLYSDDYWYGTFFQGGLKGFLRNTVSHYLNTNGRVFVHILIPILLLADTRLYAVLSPILTALIFLLALKVQDKKLNGGVLLAAAGLGLLSLLGSEIQYLRMSLYWLAAYFNYAFPLIFPLAVLWGMSAEQKKPLSRPAAVGLYLCALLSGASTEQCGVIALVLICGNWLLLKLRKEPLTKRINLCPLLTMLGYLTILLAPGSHARMERGIDGGILSVLHPSIFLARFFDVMDYLCGYGFWNVLFGALCLLAGLACLFDRSLPRHLMSGLPAAALVGLMAVMGWQAPLAVFTVCYTVYIAVTFLFFPEYQTTGLLLLGAGASVMMLIVTTLYYARTFFPCVILFLTVSWSLLFRLFALAKCPKPVSIGVLVLLAAVFFARYVPIYQGYAANRAVIGQNLQAIEDHRPGEELALSIDLDADYRFTMFFEGNYFLTNFLQYYGIPQDTPLRFTSEIWDVSGVEVNGQFATFPALEKDGQLMLPIEFVFLAQGDACSYHWTNNTFSITHAGNDYTLYDGGLLIQHMPDGTDRTADESCEPTMPFSYTYTLLYLSEDDFARCFGITFDYDAASDCYVLRNP